MQITINEVVLRDGLQDEPVVVSVADRVRIAESLLAAGLRHLEVASFVNPARVPQMAGAAELVAALPDRPDARFSAIALNRRGVERAAAAGVRDIVLVASASEGHSRANAGRDVVSALAEMAAVAAGYPGIRFAGAVSTAFVCPFDGEMPPGRIVEVASAFDAIGLSRLALADTLGIAEPGQVARTVAAVREALPDTPLALHLHDAHGRALETVDAAIDLGVARFDSAAGGYGGCPFAPGAHGNLATETLVAHLEKRGVGTGVDLGRLRRATDLVREAIAGSSPVPQPA
ncbi:hydroxymethylglutaryl-CoA lyase [Pseudonocardia sp. C8]|uniref:hydroxymethylglutaryl-CoA lyase n=1 Tax=Pseudonocardia sp. C8 TaxID=2762759 RepID=UPI001642D553|nr:hydroxymethylglutaryl-CoA lyase [Pseudonocardia sp. C8]MBC3191864.1 hydroxymethylglutaryl-CoA lyase [Pseudonocardia sp. C8]